MVEAKGTTSTPSQSPNTSSLGEVLNKILNDISNRAQSIQQWGSRSYGPGREPVDVKLMLSKVQWLFVILRAKTICFEICERQGIHSESQDATLFSQFSKDGLYISKFKNEVRQRPALVDEVYEQLQENQNILQNSKKRGQYTYSSHGPLVRFFCEAEKGKYRDCDDLSQSGRTFLTKMLLCDLERVKGFAFRDLRVTRGLFRAMLQLDGEMLSYYGKPSRTKSRKAMKDSLCQTLMNTLSEIFKGYFGGQAFSKVPHGDLCFQHTQVFSWVGTRRVLLFRVRPRRVAIYESSKRDKTKQTITGFAYYQYLELANFLTRRQRNMRAQYDYSHHQPSADFGVTSSAGENLKMPPHLVEDIERMMKRERHRDNLSKHNPNRWAAFLPNNVLTEVPPHQRRSVALNINNVFRISYDQQRAQNRYEPLDFEDCELITEVASRFKRASDTGEFGFSDEFKLKEDKFRRADQAIVESVSDEQGAQQLLKLIKAIPKIKFKLTPEQELMISTPQNLLVLGRSGTGKTTSSALRLFATDAYYKYHEQLAAFREANPEKRAKDFQIAPNFLDSNSKLKLTFVSASPVLVNEIKRFYDEFKKHFASQLLKANQARQRQTQARAQGLDKLGQVQTEFEAAGEGEEEKKEAGQDSEHNERDLLEEYVRNELKEMEQDEQLQKGMEGLAQSMEDLSSEDFPLFLTVKRLIFMLDASCDFPFFSRDQAGKQIGLESNVEWHNEQGGVFMINQYHKTQTNFDSLLKELGQKLIDFHESEETQPVDKAEAEQDVQEEQKGGEEHRQGSAGGAPASDQSSLMNLISVVDTDRSKVYSLRSQNLSFEVDFGIFETRFWPRVRHMSKLHPLVIWTEICSEIKGRVTSYKFEQGGLDVDSYLAGAGKKKGTFLSVEEKLEVYMVWVRFEQWKTEMRAYDFNDVVNHVLQQLRSDLIRETQLVHFLMVDEVQDLTQNVITLLMSLARKNIFFSGDTAQTIAKGIGFRFYDLKQVFSRSNYESAYQSVYQVPKVLQLSKNFRSHARILDLANSVVSLLELCFPQTIDKLMKESSDLEGPKPIVIDQANIEQLGQLLGQLQIWGGKSSEEKLQSGHEGSAQEEEQKQQFGCDRVVIVRDQESKVLLPAFMRNMLCLTVYECKGLEFDEVILFNFFQDSKCASQWKLLNDVVAQTKVVARPAPADFLDFEMLEAREAEEEQAAPPENIQLIDTTKTANSAQSAAAQGQVLSSHLDGEKNVETVLSLQTKRQEVYRKFAKVCTELKLLYVAITRPKTLLIIYDEDPAVRKPIQNYWEAVHAVDTISEAQISDYSQIPGRVQETLKLRTEGQGAGWEEGDAEEMRLKWRLQGFKLFKVKFYEAAVQCFTNSLDPNLVKRCQAYSYADEAVRFQSQVDQKLAMAQDKTNFLKKHERLELKREARSLRETSKQKMREAGTLFNEINMNKHAAQCFFSSGDQKGAAQVFFKLGKYGQAAECFHAIGEIRKAANLFARAELFANAFECYEELQDWDGLLQCLRKYAHKLSEADRVAFTDKYVPIALNSVYQLYADLDPHAANSMGVMGEANKGRVQQARLKLKFQKSVSIIREEQEIESEDEEQQDQLDQHLQTSDVKLVEHSSQKQDFDAQALPKRDALCGDEESKIVMIDTTARKKEEPTEGHSQVGHASNPDLDDDFEIIGDSLIEEERRVGEGFVSGDQRDFQLEILSNIDPTDEFLQSEKSFSLIEGMSSSAAQEFSILSAQSSEFSLISGSKIHEAIQAVERSQDQSGQTLCLESVKAIEGEVDSALSRSLNLDRYSVIQDTRDAMAEDIVIQKVIYYISLFDKDVHRFVKTGSFEMGTDSDDKDLDELSKALEETEAEQLGLVEDKEQFEQQLERAAFAEDMDFMLIELDGLPRELLGRILDLLEKFELYRLSLIICNRFGVQERNGRFVAAISQKYSNLGQMRHCCFIKFYHQAHLQTGFALLAQEAMHNVLALAGQGRVQRNSSFREQCFESLFLQGFWKKLVFMLDIEASLQLCFALKDPQSFRLNYLVEKLGETDANSIQEAVGDADLFAAAVFEHEPAKGDQRPCDRILSATTQPDLVKSAIEESLFLEKPLDWLQKKVMCENTTNLTSSKARLCSLIVCKMQATSLTKNFSVTQRLNLLGLMGQCVRVPSDQAEMLQALLSCFGVSWLDGLNCFASIAPNYCLVQRGSKLMGAVQQFHELSLEQERVRIVATKFLELQSYAMQSSQRIVATKKHFQDQMKRFLGPNTQRFDLEVVFPCDVDLNWFCVPKAWVRHLVSLAFFEQAYNLFSALHAELKGQIGRTMQLEVETRKLVTALTVFSQKNLFSGIEQRLSSYNRSINNFSRVFESVVARPILKVKHTASELLLKFKKVHSRIQSEIFKKTTLTLAVDDRIRAAPEFKFLVQARSEKESEMNRLTLAMAMQRFSQAAAVVLSKKFFGVALEAFEQFAQCDSYPVLAELIAAQKKRPGLLGSTTANFNCVMNLMDAHVYAKVGDAQNESKSLLVFLRTAFEQLATSQIAKIVQRVFYRSLFSLKIYDYKASHGGVRVPLSGFNNIEAGQKTAETIALPKVYLRKSTYAHIKMAISWMASLLTGLSQGEERTSHAYLFKEGVAVLQCAILNLDSERLFENRVDLSVIARQCVRSCPGTGNLGQLEFAKTAGEVKQAVKQLLMDKSAVGPMVLVSLTDQKKIAQTYESEVEHKVDAALTLAAAMEASVLAKRKEAAERISAFWETKRISIQARRAGKLAAAQQAKEAARVREEVPQPKSQEDKHEAIGKGEGERFARARQEQVTEYNYASRALGLARAACPNLVAVLHDTDALLARLVGVVGSDLIKGALDQKTVLALLHELQGKRAGLLDQINEQRVGSRVGDSADYLNSLVVELTRAVESTEQQLGDWLQASSNEVADIERSKLRYIKLEKWNVVIQQRNRKLRLQRLLKKKAAPAK